MVFSAPSAFNGTVLNLEASMSNEIRHIFLMKANSWILNELSQCFQRVCDIILFLGITSNVNHISLPIQKQNKLSPPSSKTEHSIYLKISKDHRVLHTTSQIFVTDWGQSVSFHLLNKTKLLQPGKQKHPDNQGLVQHSFAIPMTYSWWAMQFR